MLAKVRCPECGAEGSFSLVDPAYRGPYRCWKCRGLFTITMENNELKAWETLDEEEFQKQQEAESLKNRFKLG